MTDLKTAQANDRFRQRLQVYLKPRVLVLDEIGYLSLDRMAANLFFQQVSQRYEQT